MQSVAYSPPRLPENAPLYAGVELGGTKCICSLTDQTGRILDQARVSTTTPDATLDAITAVLTRWWADHPFEALGIASFGPIDLASASPTWGFITATAKPGWRQTDVGRRLSLLFPVPVAFDTDVNGAAVAEGLWGAAQGLQDYAYITVGTGVGVGLIVNGAPTRGLGHCELGHARVARATGDLWPGHCPYHADCVEGLVSGPAIQARLGAPAPTDPDHPVWTGVVHTLAGLLHNLVLGSGPRKILVGGGVITGQPHLIDRLDRALRESLAGYVLIPSANYVRAPGLGDRAGPLGPIALAIRNAEAQRGHAVAGRREGSGLR